MAKQYFEMGANFSDGWVSDNKQKNTVQTSTEEKPAHKHQLYFAKEKRRGKIVTIVQPFHLSKDNLQLLLKTLKKKLGTGGTKKENYIEFQGDIAIPLRKHLEDMGYGFKT